MKKIRPFLKWAGGKYRYLEPILSALPSGNRLIEPFLGSGAVFLNTQFPNYLLAEKNEDLINLYHLIKQEGIPFIHFCAQYFTEFYNDKEQYYQLRALFNQTQDKHLRAALFVYLNRHGYNGLCRYNSNKIFNVPFGQYVKPYFPKEEMIFFHQKSQDVMFLLGDFEETFAFAQAGDVIYCDPPYAALSATANFTHYTHKNFNYADQITLANCARQAAQKGCQVIISNHDTPFVRQNYEGAQISTFPVTRFISCQGQKRRAVMEILAFFK